MIAKQFNVSIDIKRRRLNVVEGLNQGDTGAVFHMRFYDGAIPFDFTGYTDILIRVKDANGNIINTTASDRLYDVDAENGVLSIYMNGLTENAGMMVMQVTFVASGFTLGTGAFNYFVEEDELHEPDESWTSQTNYDMLQSLIAEYTALKSELIALIEANGGQVEGGE